MATNKGIKEYDSIISAVFEAIDQMQQQGPVQHVHEEFARRAQLNWELFEKPSALSCVKQYSELMHLQSNISDILKNEFLSGEFDFDEITKAMGEFSSENCLVFVLKNQHEAMNDYGHSIEKWYGTHYRKGRNPLH